MSAVYDITPGAGQPRPDRPVPSEAGGAGQNGGRQAPPRYNTETAAPPPGGGTQEPGSPQAPGRRPVSSARRVRARRALRFARRQRSAGWLVRAAREEAGLDPDGREGWAEPPRAAKCRWALGDVRVHGAPGEAGSAHYSGTIRCGGIWACPVCAAVLRSGRADEVARGVASHQKEGGGVALLTLTLRHRAGDPLARGIDALVASWRSISSRSVWKKKAGRLGLVGTIRALEITHSRRNGWHPHLHLLLLTDAPVHPADLADLQAWLSDVWAREVTKRGARTPSRERGVDLRAADENGEVVARYLSKIQEKDDEPRRWGVAAEIARGDVKEGRKGSRTPFEFLDSGYGYAPDRELWLEYVTATKGRAALIWSRGLRARLGIGEKTDEDILDDVETAPKVGRVSREAWREVRDRPEVLSSALDLVEAGRVSKALDLLGGEVFEDEQDDDDGTLPVEGVGLVDLATGEVLAVGDCRTPEAA